MKFTGSLEKTPEGRKVAALHVDDFAEALAFATDGKYHAESGQGVFTIHGLEAPVVGKIDLRLSAGAEDG